MKLLACIILLATLATSCAPTQGTATAVSISSQTPVPAITPSETPTAVPTINVGSIHVPDPKISSPELFDKFSASSPIVQLREAMKLAGITVDAQQVANAIMFEQRGSEDGKPLVIGYYNLDPDPATTGETLEGKVPLLIATQDENGNWKWQKTTPDILDMYTGRITGAQVVNYVLGDPNYSNQIHEFGNLVMIDGELDMSVLIGNPNEWDTMGTGAIKNTIARIKNGDEISSLLNFKYADAVVAFANQHGMSVEAHHIYWPQYFPEDFKKQLIDGTVPWDDYELFLTEYAKAVVGRYDGVADPNLKIGQWTVANEISGHLLWDESGVDKRIIQKMIDKGTLTKVFEAAHDANPDAKLLINEDSLLGTADPMRANRAKFLSVIDTLQKQGAPINGVGIQNHLWLGQPLLPPKEMETFLEELDSRNLTVNYTEITISMSQANQYTGEGVSKPFADPYRRQAQVLTDILRPMAKRKGTVTFFGIFTYPGPFDSGDLNDPTANATMFDNYDHPLPKPMYYVLLQFLMTELK